MCRLGSVTSRLFHVFFALFVSSCLLFLLPLAMGWRWRSEPFHGLLSGARDSKLS